MNPSYNIAVILDPFVGNNHPRFGKVVSPELREKISKTLTGRSLTQEHIENIRKSSHKKPVYCYDSVSM